MTTTPPSKRADISLAAQLDGRAKWQNALVDSVVAAFLYRTKDNHGIRILDDLEFLITTRVKGAEKGQHQAHQGGFMQVTDEDIWAGALREVMEETGYVLRMGDLRYLTSIGPAINRSQAEIVADDRNSFVLEISGEEAEPQVGFTLPLFIADISGMSPTKKIDGEVKDLRWMTPRAIIEQYGKKGDGPHSKFNYFQMFSMALLYLSGSFKTADRTIARPGRYQFSTI